MYRNLKAQIDFAISECEAFAAAASRVPQAFRAGIKEEVERSQNNLISCLSTLSALWLHCDLSADQERRVNAAHDKLFALIGEGVIVHERH